MIKDLTYDGSRKIDLAKVPTGVSDKDIRKEDIIQKTVVNQLAIQQLQDKLYADQREGLIILLQARDAAGKDSTIKNVMSGINPQGVDVYSFKQPTHEELAHDFLWRFNKAIPLRGKIAIYNRSYYEDVLVVKVHQLQNSYTLPDRISVDDGFFKQRYKQIHSYEDYLWENGYRIIKIFLNVSKKEQKKRFLERIDDPDKNWKFSASDLKERALWDEYTKAYEDTINHTSTEKCPWYVVPADAKWYTRYLVSEIILNVMKEIDPHYPKMPESQKERLAEYKAQMLDEDEPKKKKKDVKQQEARS